MYIQSLTASTEHIIPLIFTYPTLNTDLEVCIPSLEEESFQFPYRSVSFLFAVESGVAHIRGRRVGESVAVPASRAGGAVLAAPQARGVTVGAGRAGLGEGAAGYTEVALQGDREVGINWASSPNGHGIIPVFQHPTWLHIITRDSVKICNFRCSNAKL